MTLNPNSIPTVSTLRYALRCAERSIGSGNLRPGDVIPAVWFPVLVKDFLQQNES